MQCKCGLYDGEPAWKLWPQAAKRLHPMPGSWGCDTELGRSDKAHCMYSIHYEGTFTPGLVQLGRNTGSSI
jgi:hypothetical protein